MEIEENNFLGGKVNMKKKSLLISSLTLSVIVIMIVFLLLPRGKIQFKSDGIPCSDLKGNYKGSKVIARTDSDGMLNWTDVENQEGAIFLDLKDKNGKTVYFGFVHPPKRNSLVVIDIPNRTSK